MLVPLLFVLSVVVFLLAQLVPGGPVAALIGGHATNTATVDALKARYHLNESLFSQYAAWADQVLHGNLGQSISPANRWRARSGPVCRSRSPSTWSASSSPSSSASRSVSGRRPPGPGRRPGGSGDGHLFFRARRTSSWLSPSHLLAIHFTVFPLEGLGRRTGAGRPITSSCPVS